MKNPKTPKTATPSGAEQALMLSIGCNLARSKKNPQCKNCTASDVCRRYPGWRNAMRSGMDKRRENMFDQARSTKKARLAEDNAILAEADAEENANSEDCTPEDSDTIFTEDVSSYLKEAYKKD